MNRPERVWSAVVVLVGCALMALVAVLAVFFLPLHAGSVPLPISAVLAAAMLVVVPRACVAATGRVVAAVAPIAVWAVITLGLAIYRSPLYPQVLLIVADWRLVLLLGMGGVAAAFSLSLPAPTPVAGRARDVIDGAPPSAPSGSSPEVGRGY